MRWIDTGYEEVRLKIVLIQIFMLYEEFCLTGGISTYRKNLVLWEKYCLMREILSYRGNLIAGIFCSINFFY